MMYSKHGRVKTPAGAGAEALETMLEKIMEDCMGGSLYNALDVTMGQGTFGIQFDLNAPTSTFDLSTITLNGYESNALFHEMFHIYQAYQETPQSYVDAAANLEVVAAIAQYRYLKRLPEFTPGSEWARVYENTNIGQNIVVFLTTSQIEAN